MDTKRRRRGPREGTGPIRILHVDDEPSFADVATAHLEREYDQLNVETATSASEAFERLAEEEFDCVVSDYSMPGRNGVEFLEDVRRNHPELPFILFTGKGSEEVASEAISAGVTDYLQKQPGSEDRTIGIGGGAARLGVRESTDRTTLTTEEVVRTPDRRYPGALRSDSVSWRTVYDVRRDPFNTRLASAGVWNSRYCCTRGSTSWTRSARTRCSGTAHGPARTSRPGWSPSIRRSR
jgi:CheY-like chemotaxis protein